MVLIYIVYGCVSCIVSRMPFHPLIKIFDFTRSYGNWTIPYQIHVKYVCFKQILANMFHDVLQEKHINRDNYSSTAVGDTTLHANNLRRVQTQKVTAGTRLIQEGKICTTSAPSRGMALFRSWQIGRWAHGPWPSLIISVRVSAKHYW